jgi:hypothetical protein
MVPLRIFVAAFLVILHHITSTFVIDRVAITSIHFLSSIASRLEQR